MAAVTPIRAAGGVLAQDGLLAVVHRPRYDDWTLPKGKLEPGEHPLAAACREVCEETGVRAAPMVRLPSVSYPVRTPDGMQTKSVDYWAMSAIQSLGFTPGPEIDEVRWLELDEALHQLSYPHDIEVVTAWSALPAVTGTVLLVRHARAGKRSAWTGPDALRPLDPTGQGQARRLAALLELFQPARLAAAQPLRCQQTLAPLAAQTGLPLDVDPALDDDADPIAAATRIRTYGGLGGVSVLCSQGTLIPAALAALLNGAGSPAAPSLRTAPSRFPAPKASTWAVHFAGERAVASDQLRLTRAT